MESKGRSSMGHSKHRESNVHGQPVHGSTKMDMERQANRKPIKHPKPVMHESMQELMKEGKD